MLHEDSAPGDGALVGAHTVPSGPLSAPGTNAAVGEAPGARPGQLSRFGSSPKHRARRPVLQGAQRGRSKEKPHRSAGKREERLPLAAARVDLESIVLSEISQSDKERQVPQDLTSMRNRTNKVHTHDGNRLRYREQPDSS